MNTESTTPHFAATGAVSNCESTLMDDAERELAAFISAVGKKFGRAAAGRAATNWIEALEAIEPTPSARRAGLRGVTIAAAGRVATQELKPNVSTPSHLLPGKLNTDVHRFDRSRQRDRPRICTDRRG